jgi:hypothetical protein
MAVLDAVALLPGLHDMPVRSEALAREIGAGTPLVVRFENGAEDVSGAVVFDLRDGVRLLVGEGGFEMNFVRALMVALCYLAAVAALGLAAGAAFSFPVAGFAAASAVASALMIHYFTLATTAWAQPAHGHAGEEEQPPSLLRAWSEEAIRRADAAVAPALQFAPLGRLADGLLVPWRSVAGAVGILGLAYPVVLGLGAAALLRRRELARPG